MNLAILVDELLILLGGLCRVQAPSAFDKLFDGLLRQRVADKQTEFGELRQVRHQSFKARQTEIAHGEVRPLAHGQARRDLLGKVPCPVVDNVRHQRCGLLGGLLLDPIGESWPLQYPADVTISNVNIFPIEVDY